MPRNVDFSEGGKLGVPGEKRQNTGEINKGKST